MSFPVEVGGSMFSDVGLLNTAYALHAPTPATARILHAPVPVTAILDAGCFVVIWQLFVFFFFFYIIVRGGRRFGRRLSRLIRSVNRLLSECSR
jgi:hypothetical protein